jgi:hypothetical protein
VLDKREKEQKKEFLKKEKELKAKKFVIVEKKDYREYAKIRQLREETRHISLSNNLV